MAHWISSFPNIFIVECVCLSMTLSIVAKKKCKPVSTLESCQFCHENEHAQITLDLLNTKIVFISVNFISVLVPTKC